MREMVATLDGRTVTLAATFGAAQSIAKTIGDPLLIAREAALEAMMGQMGQVYQPKWMFTVENVPAIIHAGMKAAGSVLTMAQVQELVFSEGFISAKEVASEYLALLVMPKSEELSPSQEGGEAGE